MPKIRPPSPFCPPCSGRGVSRGGACRPELPAFASGLDPNSGQWPGAAPRLQDGVCEGPWDPTDQKLGSPGEAPPASPGPCHCLLGGVGRDVFWGSSTGSPYAKWSEGGARVRAAALCRWGPQTQGSQGFAGTLGQADSETLFGPPRPGLGLWLEDGAGGGDRSAGQRL